MKDGLKMIIRLIFGSARNALAVTGAVGVAALLVAAGEARFAGWALCALLLVGATWLAAV